MPTKKQATKSYKQKQALKQARQRREALSRRHHPKSRARKGRGKSRSWLQRQIEREVQKYRQRHQAQQSSSNQSRNHRNSRRKEVARRPSETGWDFVRRLARKNPGQLFEVLPGLAVKYHGGLQSYFFYVRSGGDWKPVESKLLLPPELLG